MTRQSSSDAAPARAWEPNPAVASNVLSAAVSAPRGDDYARAILDSWPDPVLILNPDDRKILAANRAFLEKTGHKSESEVIGSTCHQASGLGEHPCSPDHPCAFEEALSAGCAATVEQVRSGDEGTRFYEVSATPLRNGDNRIVQMLHLLRDVTPKRLLEQTYQHLAFHDPLTSLPNRSLLQDRLEHLLAQAARSQQLVAVLFLDLFEFKRVNDTLGHAAGDKLLCDLAERLRQHVRKSDTLARLGGDEFVLLLSAKCQQDIHAVLRNILTTLARPFPINERQISIGVNIGVAVYPNDARDGNSLLHLADIAMYEAKKHGTNTFQFFSEHLNQQVLGRQSLERDLSQALAGDEFHLVYQPQFNLSNGQLVGMEAFLRWEHPRLGGVSPAAFLPLAEEVGLGVAIDDWVLHHACRQCRKWQQKSPLPVKVAVNISCSQFKHPHFVSKLRQVLSETGLTADSLELELTEAMLHGKCSDTKELLREIRQHGVKLVIDDFGTGYSSLNILNQFPIDRLKIAQDFVRGLPRNRSDAAIVEAILAVAHSLGKDVLAEGVETWSQVDYLLRRNCSVMQGYYFARPATGDDLPSRTLIHPLLMPTPL